MNKKFIIPEVELEIGENLYLQIKEVSFIPFKKGYITGRPEDCYEDEPAEADWKDDNCKLVIKHYKYVQASAFAQQILGLSKVRKLDSEQDFDCDPALSVEYYDQIIEQIEEDLKNDN